MLSTVYGTRLVGKKPEIVSNYNASKFGIDKLDQVLAYYSFDRKTNKWWKNIFFYVLDVSLSNACVIYRQSHRNTSYLNFRIEVIRGLLQPLLEQRRNAMTIASDQIDFSRFTQNRHVIFVNSEKSSRSCVVCKVRAKES